MEKRVLSATGPLPWVAQAAVRGEILDRRRVGARVPVEQTPAQTEEPAARAAAQEQPDHSLICVVLQEVVPEVVIPRPTETRPEGKEELSEMT